MIGLMKEDEEKLVELWETRKCEWNISFDDLVELAKNGASTCEEYCYSREVCGDACYCTRELFPSRDCYEAYKFLREVYLDALDNKVRHEINEGITKNDN